MVVISKKSCQIVGCLIIGEMLANIVLSYVVLSVVQDCITFGAHVSSNYYCADIDPQPLVNIEQLMGMWYGIEIISHKSDEEPRKDIFDYCAVIHITEENYLTTNLPLHRNNYENRYGSTYPTYSNRDVYNPENEQRYPYERTSPPVTNYYPNYYNKRRYEEGLRKLRLLWDENGSTTEYTLRYNDTRAGFWISSGPNNGSSLIPKFNHFAGTVQVLKAVGDHMVLVFCHQLPDRRLYSTILSRVPTLSEQEIHGVHNLLDRRGLITKHIKRICTVPNHGSLLQSSFIQSILSLIVLRISLAIIR